MMAIAFAVIAVGSWVVPGAVLLGLWGLIATCAPVGWFTWLAKALPYNAQGGGGLMVAVIQLAITAGATVGGFLYDGIGYQATFLASGLCLLIAATLSVIICVEGLRATCAWRLVASAVAFQRRVTRHRSS